MITLLLLSGFVDARHRGPKHPKQGGFARMNAERHRLANMARAEAAELNAKRHAAAETIREKVSHLKTEGQKKWGKFNARRHAVAAALRDESSQQARNKVGR